MLVLIGRTSWAQRLLLGLGVLAAGVVGLESLSAETVATGAGLLICGLLSLVVLAMPTVRATVVAELAVVSLAFTALCQVLPDGLDNTFGLVETVALVLLTVRSVIDLRPGRSVLVVPLLYLAIVLTPTRCYDLGRPYLEYAVLVLGFGLLLAILLGMYLRLHDQRRIDAAELARQAQRLAYARDLHDFVAHHVTAIVAQTQAVRFTSGAGQRPGPEVFDELLAGIERSGAQALASMRGMISVLRNDEPAPARTTLGEAVAEPVGHFAGPPVTTDLDDDLATTRLAPPVLDAVHHVVQESLTNVLRHAGGATAVGVRVRTRPDARLEVVVTDDGTSTSDTSGSGFGLIGLGERVEVAGGTLTAGPADGGWRVRALLPLTPALPS
ncbi:histidine kinase [Amycolatopsis sp. PS_44_ISF1]|uniref:sensor histidine kinase n=1 Tax=Amycolatopsis sp. PS_44_ISF1 TaxID=2974917 RepID=UPI0028DEAC1E|nr:histidine kinase [Amycolatopsis sp. PS_44_ISF1]MDT8911649.1 histidine kinase [Amycolatopsis sp. PS_44_ISF1]